MIGGGQQSPGFNLKFTGKYGSRRPRARLAYLASLVRLVAVVC